VPTFLAEILDRNERGLVDDDTARDVITRCTDCGRCQEHCHLHRPLPAWLREARTRLLPRTQVAPVGELVGPHDALVVVVEADGRDLATAVAFLGPVAVLRTPDRLGAAALEHGELELHFAQLRARLAGRTVVVADGGVGEVLTAAGVPFRWLWDVVADPTSAQGSCVAGGDRGLACCGARGPLAAHHAADAARVAVLFAQRGGGAVRDARCRSHLAACGVVVADTLDRLLEAR
jgi:hypothetical protein